MNFKTILFWSKSIFEILQYEFLAPTTTPSSNSIYFDQVTRLNPNSMGMRRYTNVTILVVRFFWGGCDNFVTILIVRCFWGGCKKRYTNVTILVKILLVRCFWGGCKRRPLDHLCCSTLALSQVFRLRWLSIHIRDFQSIFVTFNTYSRLSIHICDFQSLFVTFNTYSAYKVQNYIGCEIPEKWEKGDPRDKIIKRGSTWQDLKMFWKSEKLPKI